MPTMVNKTLGYCVDIRCDEVFGKGNDKTVLILVFLQDLNTLYSTCALQADKLWNSFSQYHFSYDTMNTWQHLLLSDAVSMFDYFNAVDCLVLLYVCRSFRAKAIRKLRKYEEAASNRLEQFIHRIVSTFQFQSPEEISVEVTCSIIALTDHDSSGRMRTLLVTCNPSTYTPILHCTALAFISYAVYSMYVLY